MPALALGIALLSGFTSFAGTRFNLREGSGGPTRIGTIVLGCQVGTTGLAITLIVMELVATEAARRRRLIIEQWTHVPLTDPVIALRVNFDPLREGGYGEDELLRPLLMEMGVDFRPSVTLREVHMSGYLLEKEGTFEVTRVRIKDYFPDFPDTVGALIGHSLKFLEDDVRPYTILQGIDLYANPEAKKPFLCLRITGHERVGGYYRRVWYPDEVKIMPSLNEGHMNHAPFVFLAELLPDTPPFD